MPDRLHLGAGLALALVCLWGAKPAPFRPVPPTAVAQDSLIRPGETHFAHLWQLTFGGQNAEAYWSGDGTKLIWQCTDGDRKCDQEYVMDLVTGACSSPRRTRSEEHTSELQSLTNLVCRLLLEKKKHTAR